MIEDITKQLDILKDLLIKKNSDYGSSVFSNPLFTKASVEDAILIRMGDKVKRLNQLKDKTGKVEETFNDTVRDLAGYCILYLALKEKK